MRFSIALAALMGCLIPMMAWAGMTIEDNGSDLTVLENRKPVLVYHYKPVSPPEGVPERYTRACYIHPLYGLDGDILTQDFPSDHYHHRGVFWAWPRASVGNKPFNLWLIQSPDQPGARQHFEKWLERKADVDETLIGVQNIWRYDDDPKPVAREKIWFRVSAAEKDHRAIDFRLVFENIGEEPVTLLGAVKKGYGGFCIRPNAERKPLTFTTKDGVSATDVLHYETPWADVSSRTAKNGSYSGVALFQHPKNPGYPHPGWIFRHYGFLGASWPHLEPYTLEPGKHVELCYRLLVHRGTAEEAEIAKQFREYAESPPSRP